MKKLLEQAGREFLKAFGAALIVVLPGVLVATNLDQAFALGVSALIASFAAGFKAVQVFVPQLTFAALLPQPVAAWVDAFVRTAVATLLVSVISFLNEPQYDNWKAVLFGALTGAVAAGLRALEGLTTKGETPVTNFGVSPE